MIKVVNKLQSLLLLAAISLFSLGTYASEAPRVVLTTDLGDITLELYPEKAPKTVANFLQYVKDGFYIGTIFHRVVPGFVVQGGGLTFDFVRKETRDPVVNESIGGLSNTKGSVAMARLPNPDSATSQFFVNLEDNPHLNADGEDAGYTVFARVIQGMDVIFKITKEPQGRFRPQAPDLPVRILSIQQQP